MANTDNIACTPATHADVDALLQLYQDVQDTVAGTDNDPLWEIGIHPSPDELASAIDEGGLLVLRDEGKLAGAVIVNGNYAQGYDEVAWNVDASAAEAQVIHLFAIHPDYQGQGLARKLIEASCDLARNRGARALRLDTLTENVGAQKTYEALGFDRICECMLFYPTLENYKAASDQNFVLYEKAL